MITIIKRTVFPICLFLSFLVLFSCSKEKIKEEEDTLKRTVLIYMAADNDLNRFAGPNIDNAMIGAAGNNLKGGNLLIYIDPAGDVPKLLQITKNKKGVIEKQVIRTYEEHNSASPEVMKSVIDEVLSNVKFEADSYGLILWSHGSAWLPYSLDSYLRSFGQDRNSGLSMDDLKYAIPDNVFDYIIFDACYMGSVEVAYALKDKADYILASPTEIMGDGMPYQYIVKDLFSDEPYSLSLKKVGHQFYTYYNEQSGISQSATISLTEINAFPRMVSICRNILYGKEQQIFSLPIKDLQIMEYLRHNSHALYDFEDYIKQLASAEQYLEFQTALSELVLYRETTEKSFYVYPYLSLPINRFSGLSVYVPQSNLEKLNDWYKTQDWYKAVYE